MQSGTLHSSTPRGERGVILAFRKPTMRSDTGRDAHEEPSLVDLAKTIGRPDRLREMLSA